MLLWLMQMKCNKASGGGGIPAEVYKPGRATLVRHLHRLPEYMGLRKYRNNSNMHPL